MDAAGGLKARQYIRLCHMLALERITNKIEEKVQQLQMAEMAGRRDMLNEILEDYKAQRDGLVQKFNEFSYVVVISERHLELVKNNLINKPVFIPSGIMDGLALRELASELDFNLISPATAEAADAAEAPADASAAPADAA